MVDSSSLVPTDRLLTVMQGVIASFYRSIVTFSLECLYKLTRTGIKDLTQQNVCWQTFFQTRSEQLKELITITFAFTVDM